MLARKCDGLTDSEIETIKRVFPGAEIGATADGDKSALIPPGRPAGMICRERGQVAWLDVETGEAMVTGPTLSAVLEVVNA